MASGSLFGGGAVGTGYGGTIAINKEDAGANFNVFTVEVIVSLSYGMRAVGLVRSCTSRALFGPILSGVDIGGCSRWVGVCFVAVFVVVVVLVSKIMNTVDRVLQLIGTGHALEVEGDLGRCHGGDSRQEANGKLHGEVAREGKVQMELLLEGG